MVDRGTVGTGVLIGATEGEHGFGTMLLGCAMEGDGFGTGTGMVRFGTGIRLLTYIETSKGSKISMSQITQLQTVNSLKLSNLIITVLIQRSLH